MGEPRSTRSTSTRRSPARLPTRSAGCPSGSAARRRSSARSGTVRSFRPPVAQRRPCSTRSAHNHRASIVAQRMRRLRQGPPAAPAMKGSQGGITAREQKALEKLDKVRARPGRSGALSYFYSKLVLDGAFVWARKALNSLKRRFLGRAVGQERQLPRRDHRLRAREGLREQGRAAGDNRLTTRTARCALL